MMNDVIIIFLVVSCPDPTLMRRRVSWGLVIKPGTERNEMEQNEMEKIVESVYSNVV